jgi:hypothetical protein
MSLSPQFWVYCDGFVWDSWIANFLMPLLNPSTITKLNYFGVFADAVIEYRIFYLWTLRQEWLVFNISSWNNSIFLSHDVGKFVLTEAFPDIKLNNKINLIKFRASLGEVGKGTCIY